MKFNSKQILLVSIALVVTATLFVMGYKTPFGQTSSKGVSVLSEQFDADGFLKITDRKKEMFKTSGGKYVAPQVLENSFKQSRFIEQIMVIGDGEKMPAAFIQPAFDFVKEWAVRHNIDLGNSNEDLCNNPKVIARIQEDIDEANKKFGNWEQVKRFELTPDLWSINDGHLTPTMKLKRKIIKEKYQTL